MTLIRQVKIEGSSGNIANVNAEGQVHVVLMGKVIDENSSATPLLADAIFTGTAVSTLDFGFIFVTIFSDVASATDGLSIEQSSDGANWDNTDEFTILAGTGKTYSIQPAAQWFRIVYTNGGTDQAAFRLQTVFKKTSSLPSSHRLSNNLSQEDDGSLVIAVIKGDNPGGDFVNFKATTAGNFKMSVEELESGISVNSNSQLKTTPFDSSGAEIVQPVSAFGDLRTSGLHPQFQGSFEYTVDNTDLITQSTTNGGTVTQASGMGIVTSSTTTNSSASIESKRHARYKSGLGGLLRFTALFTTPVAATEQYAGIMDEPGSSAAFKNGYAVGYDGTTFGFHRFQNDSKTTVAQANWDDPLDGTGLSGMTIDQTKLNVFAIQYQYLGAGAIRLFVESDTTGMFVLVHTINYANINVEPSTHNPNFHFVMHVHNKGTTSNLIMKSSSYGYFVEGKTRFLELHQPVNSSGNISLGGVSTEAAILTIRNKSLYASKTNFIDIILEHMWGSIEASSANNLGSVRLVINATLGGTPSYSDINTSDSVVEIDTDGTTVTGGKEIYSSSLAGKNDKLDEKLIDHKFIIAPGETLTIAGLSVNGATIQSGVLWRELF